MSLSQERSSARDDGVKLICEAKNMCKTQVESVGPVEFFCPQSKLNLYSK